ncbi:amino acid ABC transporter substrate-binding protein [Alloscardovia macacae]|uniref:Amino acid ABC transporter substrate-binding protein n=1 Tax=Alloscardovia macacae TaxID=1160091 RepID=A0A1Y2SZ00_9BIFI|nr:iron transporter [Alloscardovia macacae]OTA26723.1 amino acid ABC transporter substrate-binding protein [Alloscardovia macacae]OTA29589.1 amino acid ABC transporter substrate-binding protein [Alloscardovia macacae]
MAKKATVAALALLLAGSLGLGACGVQTSTSSAKSDTSSSQKSDAKSDNKSESTSDGAGFEEFPIGDDKEVGPLNVAMVYFQPVDMEPAGMGLSAAESSFHLEADIHALANNDLGYAKGDFVPDLTVSYEIINKSTNETAASGTFMQMNADDGPHYGGNVKLDQAGSYTVKLSIASPAEKGWALHVDKETGVKGKFWTTPLEVSYDWDYTPMQW